MPFEFDRDDLKRRLKLTVKDPITAAECIAAVEQQRAEGAWSYGLLVDARTMSVALVPADVRVFVDRVRELVAVHGPRGPIAFVTRQASAISSVQIYMFFGGKTDSLEVFWDMDDAVRWLDQQMAERDHDVARQP